MRQGLRDVGGTVPKKVWKRPIRAGRAGESPIVLFTGAPIGRVAWAVPTLRMKGRSQEDRPVGGPRKGRRRRVPP